MQLCVFDSSWFECFFSIPARRLCLIIMKISVRTSRVHQFWLHITFAQILAQVEQFSLVTEFVPCIWCTFVMCFIGLSSQWPQVCKVLITMLLNKLENFPSACALSQSHVIGGIVSLCTAECVFDEMDLTTISAILNHTKTPSWVIEDLDGIDNFLKFSLVVLSAIFKDRDWDSWLVSVESSPDLPIPTREDTLVQRPRLDTGKDIFTQLTSVLNESCSSGPAVLVASAARTKNNDGDVIVSHAVSPSDNLDAVRLTKYCFTDLLILWLFFLLSWRPHLWLKMWLLWRRWALAMCYWTCANRSPSCSALSVWTSRRAAAVPQSLPLAMPTFRKPGA